VIQESSPFSRLNIRMTYLVAGKDVMLSPQYQSNPTIVAVFKKGAIELFPGREWLSLREDSKSELWWDRLRGILDSFVGNWR
jgi:hypothetical protein